MTSWLHADTLIIGAGPTGLSAARRLEDAGADWLLVERESYPGGLAASFRKDGFTWDIGGHVAFSHDAGYERLLDELIPQEEWRRHERAAGVRLCGRWVPYPFQYNASALPPDEAWACVRGVVRLYARKVSPDRSNFQRFIDTHFGEGIAALFMNPYNLKAWGWRPEKLSASWIGERVAPVDLEQLLFNVMHKRQDRDWGPNNMFRYPLEGGIGAIWRRLAWRLPSARLHLNAETRAVSTRENAVTLADGRRIRYGTLISTMPLDRLLAQGDLEGLKDEADHLAHSSVHVVGLGMRGRPPQSVERLCWMYFPENDCPFYRATVLSNYSPQNAPNGHWSLLLEVSESPEKPVQATPLLEQCVSGCLATGILESPDCIVTTWQRRAEYGYPTPTLDRDARLAVLLPALEEHGILSCGRFGAWKYELGNMDHSFLQGTQAGQRAASVRIAAVTSAARIGGSAA